MNTMPPLKTSLASRGTAPDQNVKMPSSLNIRVAQAKLFLYSFLASMDCILYWNQHFRSTMIAPMETYRVLIVSKGCVTYLLTRVSMQLLDYWGPHTL